MVTSGPHEKKQIAETVGAKYVSLDDLLQQSDFVVPLCPLKKETTRLFNKETFKKMKPDAILINCSRGPVVDQEALVWAIKNNVIGAAGLDVTTPEPLPIDSPLLLPEYRSKIVVLPHIGSSTVRTRANMGLLAAENMIEGFNNYEAIKSANRFLFSSQNKLGKSI